MSKWPGLNDGDYQDSQQGEEQVPKLLAWWTRDRTSFKSTSSLCRILVSDYTDKEAQCHCIFMDRYWTVAKPAEPFSRASSYYTSKNLTSKAYAAASKIEHALQSRFKIVIAHILLLNRQYLWCLSLLVIQMCWLSYLASSWPEWTWICKRQVPATVPHQMHPARETHFEELQIHP